jgi:hypothetical protein
MSKHINSRNDLADGGRPRWTRAEQDMLAELAPTGLGLAEIARRMGRSANSAGYMANRMGVRIAIPGSWTPEEEAHLARLLARHGAGNVRAIARALGRTDGQINLKLLHRRDVTARRRKCMACQTVFRSEGAHHRMCCACRPGNGLPEGW